MNTGYEDIENLTQKQETMLDESLNKQQDIVNKQTQMNIDAIEKNKAEVDEQTTKTNKGLYAEYQKAKDPYGVNAEQLYSRGLGNSGYAETTQTNLYNTYQKNITDTINNSQKLKADFDFQINQARQTGDITLAQNALEIYKQKMQLATQEYELRNNREQYLYQKEQDALAQSNWEKEYAYQQERANASDKQWQQTFDYNASRDTIADNQWQQSFDYNKYRDDIADKQYQQTFDYNANRDTIADNQWQQQFDYNKSRDDVSDKQYAEQMAYQKQRDSVADSQWAKEYALSKSKASSSSGGSLNVNNSTGNTPKIELGSYAKSLLDGLSNYGIQNSQNQKDRNDAMSLIYGDQKMGLISEEEAEYLFKQLGL